MTASLDGLGTDKLYQMTVWHFVELLKLKAVPNIKVTVNYVDNEVKYTVNYTIEETTYTVEIDGEGSIPKRIDPPIEPDNPTPIPIPEPISNNNNNNCSVEICSAPIPMSSTPAPALTNEEPVVTPAITAPEVSNTGLRTYATGDSDKLIKDSLVIILCILVFIILLGIVDMTKAKKR